MNSAGTAERILVAVTGMSPQIVTETVYALYQQNPERIPTRIYLITTLAGAESARRHLLGEHSRLAQLRRDYALPEIQFDDSQILCIADADGQPMADIRSRADNEAAADYICQQVFKLIRRFPDASLHGSLAGGRKTMGFYLGYALSLFGRDQDRLSHVLVEEPFEGNPEFFYPTPAPHQIQTRDHRLIDASRARVDLADIEFVRMGQSLKINALEPLLKGDITHGKAVRAVQNSMARPELVIDLSQRNIRIPGVEAKIPPAQMALYALIAENTLDNIKVKRIDKHSRSVSLAQQINRFYFLLTEKHLNAIAPDPRTGGEYGMTQKYLETTRSELNKTLHEKLGGLAEDYLVKSRRFHDVTYYFLDLAPGQICFDPPLEPLFRKSRA